MFVLKSPELAKDLGLLGAKAQIARKASWQSYFSLHAQIISVGGILIFGFVTSWIFGREYVDKTVKDLLALPYSRSIIVTAKFIAATDFGDYFPWSIPAIYSGIAEGESAIGWNSLFIIFVTSLVGFFSTIYWWLFTDQY